MSKSKRFRLLCLLFVLLLCFQSFGLGVSAAGDENLINSDLTEWTNLYPDCTVVAETSKNGVYFIQSNVVKEVAGQVHTKSSHVYELANMVSGHSYTFSLHLLSLSEVHSFLPSVSEAKIYGGMLNGNGYYSIGLCSYNSTTGNISLVDNSFIVINKDNYLDYFGTDIKITFELPNIVNPCICISYTEVSTSTTNTLTYIKDINLVDNTINDQDGILSRLFAWFQEKFDSIGDSFSDLGNKLTDLKDGFINKITELKTSFENKITELKESFTAKIDELKQSFIDLKNDLIEGIQSLFVPDEEVILDWKADLAALLEEHLGIIYTCSDLFTEILQMAFNIINEAPDTYFIKIPDVSFEAAGTTVPVFTAQNIDFSFMEKPVFKTMYGMYTVAMYIFFGALEVKYALRVYRKVMNN